MGYEIKNNPNQKGEWTLHLGIGDGECREIKFDNYGEFIAELILCFNIYKDRVWVHSSEGFTDNPIIITHDTEFILHYIDSDDAGVSPFDNDVHYLQEYSSYEEAYKVALSMMESNPLCYDKGDDSQIKITLSPN